ncbi:MAG TPA: NADH-quinone oxidoreductase subunit H [Variovorax sp.]
MTLLAGLIAQLLHIGLIAAAAPTLVGVLRWMQARLAGRVGPSPLQPWRELIRLLRKQTLLAESASGVTTYGPVAGAATTAVAAALVPSFALSMTFAPFADLLAIAGLLMAARCSLALAAMDAGTALGGVGASRAMLLAALVEPALLLVLFALALLAGSLDLDLIAAAQMESGADWRIGLGIALGATVLVALADTMRHEALASDLAGRGLALAEVTEALRLLVWFNLIGAAFLPFGMARSDAGPIAWAVGLTAWLARTLLFAAVLALLHAVHGRINLPRAAQMLGVAALLGLLAVVFLFADMGTT